MEGKEICTILKYKRPHDSWLCPECDTENSLSLGKCTVCGCRKTSTDIILKQWTEADDRPVIPPKKTPTHTPTPSGPVFKDMDKDDYIPEEENKNKIIWGIIIAIIIIGLIIAASQGSTSAAYSDAMNEFNSGNYETAINMFEDLPSSYKDVSYMLDESKYQCATEYLNSGDFTTAESLFESISYHGDSAEKLNECKYQAAYALFNSGSYAEAKSKFMEISSYSDSTEMASECDYSVAMNYKNNGEYVKALKAFSDLGAYKDSTSQFSKTENALISYNRKNGYYYNETSMFGEWSDSLGNYVTYTNKGNGNANASYNLGYSEGQFFKLTNGVHYHGDDYSGWKKQWIYQRVDNNSVQVYDFVDGEIYNLSRN